MDSDYIQHVRYKLQKRLKRLNTATMKSFHGVFVQCLGFLTQNEITKGILEDLERRTPDAEKIGEAALKGGHDPVGVTELDHVAISYWVLKKALASGTTNYVLQIGRHFGGSAADVLDRFRDNFVEPLFDYIDEQLDDKRMTLALLKKYKHRCEWFRRAELLAKCQAQTQKGEELLAYDLYEYLHDQGVQFHIEPQSESGRIDMISDQAGPDRLVADAKIFNPAGGQDRSYIIKGFRQVYDYVKDYNETFGYLVIFKTCEEDLSIPTPYRESGTPFISHNNKTIFFIVVDVCAYATSASKRGKLKAYEITPAQFVDEMSANGIA